MNPPGGGAWFGNERARRRCLWELDMEYGFDSRLRGAPAAPLWCYPLKGSAVTRHGILCTIGFVTAGLGLVSCAAHRASPQPEANSPIASASDPGRHATYSRRLQDVMERLQRETIDHWPEPLDDEHVDAQRKSDRAAFAEARPLADALAFAADEIPRSVRHLVLLEADRRAFEAQAETLRDQALRLSAAARQRDRDQMRQVLDSINATCRSCHARFLDVSGPLSRL